MPYDRSRRARGEVLEGEAELHGLLVYLHAACGEELAVKRGVEEWEAKHDEILRLDRRALGHDAEPPAAQVDER